MESKEAPVRRQAEAPQTTRTGRAPRAKDALVTERSQTAVAKRADPDAGVVRVRGGVDRVMLAIILLLLALGSVMVFSASYPSALAEKKDSLFYIKKQLMFLGIGALLTFAVVLVPLHWMKKLAIPFYAVSLVLLVAVLIPGIGISNGEARRWIGFTNFTIQPSEIMKAALTFMLAWYMDTFHEFVVDRTNWRRYLLFGVFGPCAFVGAACLLVLLEKHLSGTVIVGMIGLSVMFIGGCHLGWTILTVGTGGVLAAVLFLLKNPYAMKRITTFGNDNADKLSDAWQLTQGQYAIGSGGTLGVGLGASRQKYSYVSEAQNDFIFSIWCEETGFVGAVALIVLFLLFIIRGYTIAMRAPDTFSSLVVFGIVSQVGIQALLNIGVVTGALPTTGITLPFFSYGGSSLIILMAEMGVVLAVSRHSYQIRQ